MPDATIKRTEDASVLCWHPLEKVFVAGWQDGTISVWAPGQNSRQEETAHRRPILFLEWSPDGTRLISGDESGLVCVWRWEARGRLASICQYRKSGALTHCCFCIKDAGADGAAGTQKESKGSGGGSSIKLTDCPFFFFGGELGLVSYADDMGHCMGVQVSAKGERRDGRGPRAFSVEGGRLGSGAIHSCLCPSE